MVSSSSNTRGGARAGAGRKPKEPTIVKRIPRAILPAVDALLQNAARTLQLGEGISCINPASEYSPSLMRPLFGTHISAGFPSPADDYIECGLDLNDLLIKHPSATFFIRVSGDSMIGAGIYNGDILTVDRALRAAHGNIVIAIIEGELTVKRLYHKDGRTELRPENPDYAPRIIKEADALEIWGVVTSAIRQF